MPCFPEIGRQLQLLDEIAPIVIDGELAIVDKESGPQFDRLRRRLLTKRPMNVQQGHAPIRR
ncbi:MAG TPA: hypothetical protein VL180_09005 [Burkholderiales bacterium]|jgi:ATP-dependent DNA ligase|nr:hypothetical protein [Burkholderiales bacterium]